MEETNKLLQKANQIFLKNFSPETNFERAIFFSWYCGIKDCKFCYMITQEEKNKGKIARRTTESILAELLIAKKLDWDIGFVSGGIGAYKTTEFLELLKKIKIVLGKKVWINIGALKKLELKKFKPYIKGVVASIETINPKVHRYVCPSKPVKPYEEMLLEAKKLGLKRAVTVILGLEEKKSDYKTLKNFIKKYEINKIHFYGLNPQKGTVFENKKPPTKEYQAWWIAKTRIDFPKIDIQFGIWLERINYISYLLGAGANTISKFPMIKYIGTKKAELIEKQAEKAGRKLKGILADKNKIRKINWESEIDKLILKKGLKEKIKLKLKQYLKKI